MNEVRDFAYYAPFIIAAYGASFIVVGGLIALRLRKFIRSRRDQP